MTSNQTQVPKCIGVIMDGNRRWARAQGLPTLEGHRKGYRKLKDLITWCKEADVRHLVVYALSTENLKRSEEEVSYLLDLFREMAEELQERNDDSTVRFIGDSARFPRDIQDSIESLHAKNKPEAAYHIWIAAPYGGRAELVHVVNQLAGRGAGPYTERDVSDALWSAGMPDPDIIIRTGGDYRLSNFLPWQSVYAELFFVDTPWPAFTKEEFFSILNRYAERERRYGA
jgi:undecaprenyl diphosphate synthase